MVVLLETAEDEFSVRPDQISQLARLGVSNLALLRDKQTVGIVLEGWLFDPARSGVAVVRGIASGGRMLHPLLHIAVTTAAREGGRDVRDVLHARA